MSHEPEMPPLESLQAGELHIEVSLPERGPISLAWRGRSVDRQPVKLLRPFFARVLACAAAEARGVDMSFEALEFFNSSTIAALTELIKDARARAVRLRLRYDRTRRWQALSFDGLRVFLRDDDLLQLRSR